MEYRKPKTKIIESADESSLTALIPHNCCFYILPPLVDISLQEFEDLAVERLKLLRILEAAGQRNFKVYSDEWKQYITNELNLEGLKHFVRLTKGNDNKEADLNARRRDYLSHFILRFAYCRSEEMRRWFLAREMEYFKFKFAGLTPKDIKEFLEVYQMDYKPLSEDQKLEIRDSLVESTYGVNVQIFDRTDFYKVDFLEVLDLVATHKCYMKRGFVYVSTLDFVSIVGSKHKDFIEKGLLSHLRLLPEIQEDDRLYHVIKGLHTTYLGKNYTINTEANVPIGSLDELSKKSFPLCMRMCHDSLRQTHHMKYFGRVQFGLFLKGIGVTLEDSLKFWREEFTKVMDPDKFDKAYAYAIRYNYGQEGSRTNWNPYSCMKIITNIVQPGTFGCPFKSNDHLFKQKLHDYGLSSVNVHEVMSYVQKGHYQLACAKFFESTHDTKLEEGITHPNQYFELSQVVMGKRKAKAKEKVNDRKSAQLSQQQTFKDRLERRNRDNDINNAEYDDELWKLTQAEEELLTNKSKENKPINKVEAAEPESEPPATVEWGTDDDDDMGELSEYL